MKIGIIGVGVTGGALRKWIEENTNHSLSLYDPGLGMYDEIDGCDAAFICVPVDTFYDGTQDLSILLESIERCSDVPRLFIRSTVLPETVEKICNKYSAQYVPEFLTERRAYEDMCHQDIVCTNLAAITLDKIFLGKKNFIIQETEKDCSIVKYAHNCFGAMKVSFFNEIFKMCSDYSRVISGVVETGYINVEHTSVPGPDGRFGYGGKCFLKDMHAFAEHSRIQSLKEIVKENYINRKTIIKE